MRGWDTKGTCHQPFSNRCPIRILIIEDDAALARSLSALLRAGGHAVDHVATGGDALAVIGSEPYALAILDVGLPDIDGFTVLAELPRRGARPPVLMLTARDALDDRGRGLELGADDYLTKPFEPRELLVRIRNLLRRGRSEPAAAVEAMRYAHFGPWRLDLVQRRLVAPDERLVMLSSAEYRLLCRFIEEPNMVLARETLLPERRATAAFDRTIDLQISRLRQKLAVLPGGSELILTVRGEGYVLASAVDYS